MKDKRKNNKSAADLLFRRWLPALLLAFALCLGGCGEKNRRHLDEAGTRYESVTESDRGTDVREDPDTPEGSGSVGETDRPSAETDPTDGSTDADQPDIDLPDVDLPDIDLPDIDLPDIDLPGADTPEPPSNDPGDDGFTVSEYESRVVDLVNRIRQEKGLSVLSLNRELCRVAREKSRDMHDGHYFDHTSPTYGSPFDMMRDFGISYRTAGENIAMGYPTPEEVVDGWMNSPGHRANILKENFREIGVGYYADGRYWTQMFIG